MEIIQFEEYSEDIDFDEIRRYDIQKKIGELHQKVNLRKGRKLKLSERCKEKQCKRYHMRDQHLGRHMTGVGHSHGGGGPMPPPPPGFDLRHVENAGENENEKKKVKT